MSREDWTDLALFIAPIAAIGLAAAAVVTHRSWPAFVALAVSVTALWIARPSRCFILPFAMGVGVSIVAVIRTTIF
jgi:hypothetical protein